MAASARVEATTPEARRRMQRVRQKNTSVELELRRGLHARGLRFRIQVPVLTKPRRVADVALSGLRVAVFVDGCFWHGCPLHATWPKANAEFWRAKILANRKRDGDTNERLRAEGWTVVRVWGHEPSKQAAKRIAMIIEKRKARSRA